MEDPGAPLQISVAKAELLACRIRAQGIDAATLPWFRLEPCASGYRLSHAQERLWFLQRVSPASRSYHEPVRVRLQGEVCVQRLQAAFNKIHRRHEILRMRFIERDGVPYQMVGPAEEFPFQYHDLSGASQDTEQCAAALERDCLARGLDLAAGEPVHALLLRLQPQEYRLVVYMHHIIADGWSMGVLVNELNHNYNQPHATELAPLRFQYTDYAAWERCVLSEGPYLQRLEQFWASRLQRLAAPLPRHDHDSAAPLGQRGSRIYFEIPAELSAAAVRLTRDPAVGTRLFAVLLGAFALTLHRLDGSADVIVGTDVANRRGAAAELLIGFFVNQLPLPVHIEPAQRGREFLREVQENCDAAFEHQSYPFDRMVARLAAQRSLRHNPIFGAKLVLQNYPLAALQLGEVQWQLEPVERSDVKFDLLMDITQRGPALHGWLEHAAERWDTARAQRLIDTFCSLLAAITRDLDATLREYLQQLAAQERDNQERRKRQARQRLTEVLTRRELATPATIGNRENR